MIDFEKLYFSSTTIISYRNPFRFTKKGCSAEEKIDLINIYQSYFEMFIDQVLKNTPPFPKKKEWNIIKKTTTKSNEKYTIPSGTRKV